MVTEAGLPHIDLDAVNVLGTGEEVVREHMKQLTRVERERLYRRFRQDFDIFGYSKEEFD